MGIRRNGTISFAALYIVLGSYAWAEESEAISMNIGTIIIVLGLVCLGLGVIIGARGRIQESLGQKKVQERPADEQLTPFQ